MRYSICPLISGVSLLVACTASGPTFDKAAISPSNKANIIVYIKSWQSGAPASIGWPVDINGISGCNLHMNGYLLKQVDPGQTTITASVFSSPGTSRITFKTAPGNTYYIQMELDGAKNMAGVLGGLAGQLVAEGVSSTGGPFLFTRVEVQQAIQDLAGLKQDCL